MNYKPIGKNLVAKWIDNIHGEFITICILRDSGSYLQHFGLEYESNVGCYFLVKPISISWLNRKDQILVVKDTDLIIDLGKDYGIDCKKQDVSDSES